MACVLVPAPASALDPTRRLTQYPMDRWEAEQGLPQSTVQSIGQTPEGYLWLATNEGLVRFDGGANFTTFDPDNTPSLLNRFMHDVATTDDGTLWFGGTGGNIGSVMDGVFRSYATPGGPLTSAVSALSHGSAGGLWVGTYGEGVFRLDPGRTPALTSMPGLSKGLVVALAPSQEGDVWVATNEAVGLLDRDRFTALARFRGRPLSGVLALLEDRRGALWIGSTSAGLIRRTREGALEVPPWARGLSASGVSCLLEDREGALWIGTTTGELHRFANGKLDTLGVPQGLPGSPVRSLFEDPDGNLWVGTQTAGLLRLRNGPLSTVSTQEGLTSEYATGLLESPGGGLWVATHGGGLDFLHEGAVRSYRRADGLSTDLLWSLLLDRRGTLWIGTDGGGVCQLRDGVIRPFGARDGLASAIVYAFLEDRRGAIWIGTNGSGLYRFAGGQIEHFGKAEGLPNPVVHVLFEDRQGIVWIGTEGGLTRLEQGHFTTFTTRDGLPNDLVVALYEDEDGRLWIGNGGGGLGILQGGQFQSVTKSQGLFDNVVMQILPDGAGNLWMTSNTGLFRASRRELLDVAAGRHPKVACFSYGRSDGMKSGECNGGFTPAGIRLRDGRLCFPTIRGVVFADPRAASAGRAPPTVLIERVSYAGSGLDRASRLSLPLGVRQFQVRYTGLSPHAPEALTFRYKLEGSDTDWVEADRRREAYYSNVRPGHYTFRVRASGREGRWSTRGDEIELEVPARFRETPAFFALGLASLGLVAAIGYQLRVRGLRRRQGVLEREVDARTCEIVEVNRTLAGRTSELEEVNAELKRLSTEDALTGLGNRRQFDARLDQEWRRAERTESLLALVNVDVDCFKEYNDAYGHPAGDACLRQLGELLARVFARASDLPARLGGDEFTVILAETTLEEAVRRAEIVRRTFEAIGIPNRASKVAQVVTLSVGVAAARPGPGFAVDRLLRVADEALYLAKEQGKNQIRAVPLLEAPGPPLGG